MNLDQSAQFLRVSRATLDRWIRQGLLADAGLHGANFDGDALASWARRHDIKVRAAQRDKHTIPSDLLADAIERGAVTRGSGLSNAKAAIEAAIDALDLSAEDRASVISETLKRERMAATGLGHGVAIPHPRHPRSDLFKAARVSVLFLEQAIDWAAIDGHPVHTVILVLSPDTRVHLQLLSRIAFMLRKPDIGTFLVSQPSKSKLVEHLRRIAREN